MSIPSDSTLTQHALIVEDEPLLLDSLAMSLRRVTWLRITKARSAEDALRITGTDPPDVVITDVRMPGMGGLELLDRIRVTLPHVPVVVMTAYGVHLQRQALRRGATCFLEKPFRLSELRSVLQMLCVKHATVAPAAPSPIAFEGRIEALSLPDVIQVACLARQNGHVEVCDHNGRRGMVWVRDGDVLDALVGVESGLDAFFALASTTEGSFRVISEMDAVPRRIFVPWQELLMESARRYDESRHRQSTLLTAASLRHSSRPPATILPFRLSRFPVAPDLPNSARLGNFPTLSLPRTSIVPSPSLPRTSVAIAASLVPHDSNSAAARADEPVNAVPRLITMISPAPTSAPFEFEPSFSRLPLFDEEIPGAETADSILPSKPEIFPPSVVSPVAPVASEPAIAPVASEPARGDEEFPSPPPRKQTLPPLFPLLDPGEGPGERALPQSTIALDRPEDALQRAVTVMGRGAKDEARQILEAALVQWPEDKRLRANLSRLERMLRS